MTRPSISLDVPWRQKLNSNHDANATRSRSRLAISNTSSNLIAAAVVETKKVTTRVPDQITLYEAIKLAK